VEYVATRKQFPDFCAIVSLARVLITGGMCKNGETSRKLHSKVIFRGKESEVVVDSRKHGDPGIGLLIIGWE
jgi:hypothetical protein